MNNIILKSAGLTLLSSSILLASGWRIPEQSAKSVALSGAYVANSNGADATYYNPANMSFNENKTQTELSLTAIQLTSIDYEDSTTSNYNGSSKEENFILPTFFISSKDYDGIRYGFSFTAPGGLSKRWDDAYTKTFSEEFTLRIMELNPTVAYKVSNNFSIAGGLRVIYSDGVVKSDGIGTPMPIKRDMEGDTIEYGYNIALAYKPTKSSNISLTYRNTVDIKEEGTAKLYFNSTTNPSYDGGASVEIPLPAVLALATSFEIDKTTIELEYDKTYWSDYKALDFEYDTDIGALAQYFDDPKTRNWKDTESYRIGITHKCTQNLTAMFGFAIDKNPAPSTKIGFELPDSDAKLYSAGFDYKLSDKRSIGLGYLLDVKENRTIVTDDGYINGEFSNAKAHLLSFAYRVNF